MSLFTKKSFNQFWRLYLVTVFFGSALASANSSELRGKLKTGISKARITEITWRSTSLPILIKTSPAAPNARSKPKAGVKPAPTPSPAPTATAPRAVKMFAVIEGSYTRKE
jgi:hypothetical protein